MPNLLMPAIVVLMGTTSVVAHATYIVMDSFKRWEARQNRIKRLGRRLSDAALKAKWGTEPRAIQWEPLASLVDKTRPPANPREVRFLRFMERRPEIYQRFSDGVFAVLRTGKDTTSARKVLDEIRAAEDGGEELSMPDAVAAYLSRLWMERNPVYVGFLAVRAMGNTAADDWPFAPADFVPDEVETAVKH